MKKATVILLFLSLVVASCGGSSPTDLGATSTAIAKSVLTTITAEALPTAIAEAAKATMTTQALPPTFTLTPTPRPTPSPSPTAITTAEPVSTLPAKPTTELMQSYIHSAGSEPSPATPTAVPLPKRLTFYYFYAKWCSYCQQMKPIVKRLEADYKDLMDFTWLNVDKNSSDYWCYKYGIRSIPAYVISDLKGSAVKVWVGAKPESVLAQGIEAVLISTGASSGGKQAGSETPPDCPNEHARITYPGMNETVSGVVHFRGSADIPNFEYYKFEFRLSGALQWQYLTRKDKPVSDGDLIEWWTNTIEPGFYDVRMIVVDKTGNYPEPCVVTVNVVR